MQIEKFSASFEHAFRKRVYTVCLAMKTHTDLLRIYFAASASWTLYHFILACGSLFHIDFSHERMNIYIFNDIKADKLSYDLH